MTLLDYVAQLDPWIVLIFSLILVFIDLFVLDTQILLWFGIALVFVAIENSLGFKQPIQIITFMVVSLGLTLIQYAFNPKRRKINISEHPEQFNSEIDSAHLIGLMGQITKIIELPVEDISKIAEKDYSHPIFRKNSYQEKIAEKKHFYARLEDGIEWECETDEDLKIGDKVMVLSRANGRIRIKKLIS